MQALGTVPHKVLGCRNRIQRILGQIIQEKAEAMDHGDEEAAESFGSVLLKVQKERTMPIPLTNDTMVAVMFDMFGAGSESSSAVLNWYMTELVRSPAAMAKVQAELRDAFKGRDTITEDDVEGLCYLKLVIKEVLRLHTPVPLLLPQVCREACKIMGYDIPKDMVVFVNAWALCRDPKYWDEPEVLRPERFESIDPDYKGTNFEFLPFGYLAVGDSELPEN
ncbi:hypothetical protein U9M48_004599 [Paspalum notatum var. saurae]|uniref:Cytochrome P450 n=1 Tax=Paspalum notatum var. saurae TaxID=547442 RepID=A0AAQ3PQD0_PASNO